MDEYVLKLARNGLDIRAKCYSCWRKYDRDLALRWEKCSHYFLTIYFNSNTDVHIDLHHNSLQRTLDLLHLSKGAQHMYALLLLTTVHGQFCKYCEGSIRPCIHHTYGCAQSQKQVPLATRRNTQHISWRRIAMQVVSRLLSREVLVADSASLLNVSSRSQ